METIQGYENIQISGQAIHRGGAEVTQRNPLLFSKQFLRDLVDLMEIEPTTSPTPSEHSLVKLNFENLWQLREEFGRPDGDRTHDLMTASPNSHYFYFY